MGSRNYGEGSTFNQIKWRSWTVLQIFLALGQSSMEYSEPNSV